MSNKTSRWVQSFKALTTGLVAQNDERHQIGLGLLYTSNEHCCSILDLTTRNLNSSAFALLRSQLEAYIRGLWVLHCASPENLKIINTPEEKRKKGDVGFPSKNDMVSALCEREEFKDGALKTSVDNMWSLLCDFNHGGGVQAAWHVGRHGIGSYYTKSQVASLHQITTKISYLNSVAMAKACNSEDVVSKLTASHKRIMR
ncbi:TPA: hypothetical protein I7680_20935 [Vibrio vulnificus]|uniref:DUF6988 family protein n=1 Tax=Vibrio vulnificus TaxID=672 RepID=UPI001A2E26BF|nr:hypothetical protein [Vibrio vulnificus]MCG6277974.1 hypothetical protein [Vibrio vulnificus]HAS8173951.1 hypothetical protein [Vibrio vulnificus]HAS8448105.1 hypothetical protein [Vibrio vulnificus]HAS8457040.1 hypothetical protein [Vibrio vulnificus]HDY7726930.1 hypothetical protein [Vibrio vulnificus]